MFEAKSKVIKALQEIGYDKPFWVTFAKVNGEIRTMEAMMPTPDTPKFETPDNMPVMDLHKGQWRSFNLSRVVKVN
jgi:hypothetical protein